MIFFALFSGLAYMLFSMHLSLLFFLFFFPQSGWAQEFCLDIEKNAETKKYINETEWIDTLTFWNDREPAHPGYWNLFFAYRLYKSELENVISLKRDKKKHCYVGCRISQDVSYEAADYVAWLKEYKDITDCERHTLFEEKDYAATMDGAEIGLDTHDPAICLNACKSY